VVPARAANIQLSTDLNAIDPLDLLITVDTAPAH
jgi:hypothetical protein